MTDSSNFVAQVDAAFVFIMGISLFFLVGITIVMIYFVVRYRKSKNPQASHIDGNNTLEIIWTVIPTILVLAMFYYGYAGWYKQEEPPADAMKIKSIARMWNFSFQYPNGRTTDTLFVPLNKPVALDLIAVDVLHSFYIPAFRLKKDMVPGNPMVMWFESGQVGEYDIYCAEYCGLNHAYMLSIVKTMPQADFDKWYNDTTSVANLNKPVDSRLAGFETLKKMGCIACHSIDGVNLIGPTFKDLYNAQRQVEIKGSESTVVADDEYLKESIINPGAKIVKGYNAGLMQSYKDQLSDEQINQMIEYLKTISNKK